MNKYTKQGIISRFNPIYGGNYKTHKNAEMIESTSFLLSNDKEGKKAQFCYSATKAGKAEASYIVKIKKIPSRHQELLLYMALSKETGLGMNKDLGTEKVNIENNWHCCKWLGFTDNWCWEGT